MSEPSQVNLEVPMELLQNWSGLAIDMGGSCVKLVYEHKDDDQDNQQQPAMGKIRLAIYRNSDLLTALQWLRENCHIKRSGDEAPLVYTTGIGGRTNRDIISKELNIRLVNECEFELSTLAFKYFAAHMPQGRFLLLPTDDMLRKMNHILVGVNAFMRTIRNSSKDMISMIAEPSRPISTDLPILEVIPDLFPCLMFGITSNTWSITIEKEDGYKRVSTSSSSGGLSFLGLGSLLCCTVKTYDELIDLAEKGDNAKLDESLLEIVAAEGADNDMYAEYRPQSGQYDDNPFLFGKAASLPTGSFKQEDVIRALLGSIVRQQCELMCRQLVAENLKHVFIAGSFTNRLFVRKLMENEFQRQKVMLGNMLNGQGFDFQIHFSKYGGYLGALGAMIHSTVKSLPRHIRTCPNSL